MFAGFLVGQLTDAVAVCTEQPIVLSPTRADRPFFSLSSDAQIVTSAELSTVVLAYLQVPARPGASLPLQTVCRLPLSQVVLG